MFGALIFITFFILFTAASLLLPVQLFPGSLLKLWLNLPDEYESCLSAIINGLTYSIIVWLIAFFVNRKIAEE